jgi:hypothetical protein
MPDIAACSCGGEAAFTESSHLQATERIEMCFIKTNTLSRDNLP